MTLLKSRLICVRGIIIIKNMKVVVFDTRSAAIALCDMISAALGYPRLGSNFGNGIHAVHTQAVTKYYTDFVEKPGVSKWAVWIDSVSRAFLSNEQEVDLPDELKNEKPT